MKKYILTLIALATIVTESFTQVVSVWKNQKQKYSIESSTLDSLSFFCLPDPNAVAKYTVEAVDLGLPSGTLWASRNLGATKASESGTYYAWGETKTKKTYLQSNYKYYQTDHYTKYDADLTTLDLSDDAAHKLLGGTWRIPSEENWNELYNYCEASWSEIDGMKVLVFTGRNNNVIYIPIAGHIVDNGVINLNVEGEYWSSALTSKSEIVKSANLYNIEGKVYTRIVAFYKRYWGMPIRPVCTPNNSEETWGQNFFTGFWQSGKEIYNVNINKVDSISFHDYIPRIELDLEQKPEAIDLGLPSGLLWYSCNIGAQNAADAGGYYAWGETSEKSTYTWDTYKYGSSSKQTKYNKTDGKTILEANDDVATIELGSEYHTPTQAEWQELYDNCKREWVRCNGTLGYKMTGSNGNFIFLPAAGNRKDNDTNNVNAHGGYWSSSRIENNTTSAYVFYFNSQNFNTSFSNGRCHGFSIRPVMKPRTYLPMPDAVDLGLPSGLLWASFNLGATDSTQYGSYYAWGETDSKKSYSSSTYKYYDNELYTYTKYDENKTTLEAADDAATVCLGGNWRMPTMEDWEELFRYRQSLEVDTLSNGTIGYKLVGANGNSIFLPASGRCTSSSKDWVGKDGEYWSSELGKNRSDYAQYLNFDITGKYSLYSFNSYYRYEGRVIRPVMPKETTEPENPTPENPEPENPTPENPEPENPTPENPEPENSEPENIEIEISPMAVDLGLPSGLLWYSCNVGAEEATKTGSYYAWGETSEKSYYSWSTYEYGSSSSLSKYNETDGITTLEASDDVASIELGSGYRTPTITEWQELYDNCKREWVEYNGTLGYKMTGPNGKFIFLPAAGNRKDGDTNNLNAHGSYWSSSRRKDKADSALVFYFHSTNFNTSFSNDRCHGFSIRPVHSAE
ncbi:MAG: hypothetical protein K6G73_09485 [Marinilabiliaceae bacterium]|nr:hypothetical protein [Marinilabiliaceae bacterium]